MEETYEILADGGEIDIRFQSFNDSSSSTADWIGGDENDNLLEGLEGNDVLSGRAGNDRIIAGRHG